jgi:type VI secretion system protein ImpA
MDRPEQIEALLTGTEPSAPCGPNLEYDADFIALEQSAMGKPEQQYGDTVIPAQEPDWVAIERLSLGLFERTKDVRVAGHLTRSWIALRGLAGYADGLRVVAGLVDRWWDEVHPRLDPDGEFDATPRMNALAEVAGAHGCAQAARAQTLIDGLNVRDAARMLDGHAAEIEHYPGGRDRLQADLLRAHGAGHPVLLASLAALDAIDAIRASLSARLGDAGLLDVSDFERTLRRIRNEVLPAVGDEANATSAAPSAAVDAAADAEGTAGHAAGIADSGRLWQLAELTSRDDVRIGLEKICRYFEAHEPSHPAPILLRRTQRLLTLDFYEIIRDLAPESLPRIDALSGLRSE